MGVPIIVQRTVQCILKIKYNFIKFMLAEAKYLFSLFTCVYFYILSFIANFSREVFVVHMAPLSIITNSLSCNYRAKQTKLLS